MKQYADELLEAAGERDELRARHADYFIALAERAVMAGVPSPA